VGLLRRARGVEVNVVGIAGDCEHNSSVSLFSDGALVYAEAEERFSRAKGDGSFPRLALREALSRCASGPLVIAAAGREKESGVGLGVGSQRSNSFRAQVATVAKEMAVPVQYVDHHHAHAMTAAFFGSEDKSSIFTADGQGDSLSATFSKWTTRSIERLWVNSARKGSLGFFFAAFTEYLGYTRLRDEGKITALAAAGERVPALQRVLSEVVRNDLTIPETPRLCVNANFVGEYKIGEPLYTAELSRRLRGFRPEDIAFAAQERLEDVVVELLQALPVPPGILSLAGGLFNNVRLNYRIAERLQFIHRLSIAPPMGDEGLSIGAALKVLFKYGVRPLVPHSLALGRDAKTLDIGGILRQFPAYDAVHTRPNEVIRAASALLAAGLPVARCSGPGEFGPRALGNRSLLYRPDDPTCRKWLNESLGRDSVMPFAPSVREEELAKVSPVDPARFSGLNDMTVAVPATAFFLSSCPGVVHSDGTVRPQSVRRETYPALWELLYRYSARSGLPALLNTSLNRHGEPIVGTLLDAMRCIAACSLPILVAGESHLIFSRSVTASVDRAFGQ
jgi:carbamoyltransferase